MGVFTGQTPTSTAGADATVCLGTAFTVDTPQQAVGVRYWKADTTWDGHTIGVGVWNPAGTRIGTGSRVQLVDDPVGWVTVPLDVVVGLDQLGAVHTVGHLTGGVDLGHYAFTPNGLAAPLDNPPFHTPSNAGRFDYGPALPMAAPANTSSTAYFVDLVTVAGADLGTATTAEQARPLAGRKTAVLGAAVDTGTARPLAGVKRAQLGAAVEASFGLPLTAMPMPGQHTTTSTVTALTTTVAVAGLEVS